MCRIIPFTLPEGQCLENAPVSEAQAQALEDALAVAVTAKATTEEGQRQAKTALMHGLLDLFGEPFPKDIPARHYRAALAWLAAESAKDKREPWQVELEAILHDIEWRLAAFQGYVHAVERLTALVEGQLAPMIASRLAGRKGKPKR